ncbi:MAG: PorT family protein [Flavobacteriaceae bacterium]|nr:PorT family protein [Flavobacteriaceae bacterium]
MKKIFLSVFIIISQIVLSQIKKPVNLPHFDKSLFHFGFYFGINDKGYDIELKETPSLTYISQNGFNVGGIIDIRLNNNLNLRLEPGLSTNTKTIYFSENKFPGEDNEREISSTSIRVPLVLKFSANRIRNIRPYMLAGVAYDYNLSSNENNSKDNSEGEFRMKTKTFTYEVGLGCDIYLYYFKFSPSIRAVYGFNNELIQDDNIGDNWTDNIDLMKVKGVFLNFSFE